MSAAGSTRGLATTRLIHEWWLLCAMLLVWIIASALNAVPNSVFPDVQTLARSAASLVEGKVGVLGKLGDHLWVSAARFGAGYEPFAYEAKHPLLDELGYASAKVVVPKLLPLYLNEHLATAGAPRLREAMDNLGLPPAAELNPWPHPFP